MDVIDAIAAIRNNPRLAIDFITAVVRLFENLHQLHGVYRGTHEAVLAEAQGGVLLDSAGQPFAHINSLRESARALSNRENEIEAGLNQMARVSNTLFSKVRDVVRPLLDLSRSTRAVMAETEAQATNLANTMPTRLQGVPLGTGGSGAAIVRNNAALVSSQLNAQAAQLTARGIQPTLIPNPTAAVQAYLARVRQQAVDIKDGVARLTPVLAAMRFAAQNALRQASVVGRALLQTVLDGLIAAFETLASRLGTMLVTPLIMPKDLLEKLAQERASTTA